LDGWNQSQPELEIWVPVQQFVTQASCTNKTILVFIGPNRSGDGAKKFRCPELELEI